MVSVPRACHVLLRNNYSSPLIHLNVTLRFAHFLSVFFFPFTYIPACNIFQRLNKLLFKRQHYNSIYTPRFFTKTQYYKVVSKSERICFFFVKYVNIERLLKEKELERLSNALLLSSSPQKGYHSSTPC